MNCQEVKTGRSYDVLLDFEEDINEALAKLAEEEGIRDAMVTSGLGGFNSFTLQYPAEKSQHWDHCILQLASVQGFIRDGVPQIGVTVTLDGRDGITRTGVCSTDCRRLFYCEMMVTELL